MLNRLVLILALVSFPSLANVDIRSRLEWGARPAKDDMTPDASKSIFAIHHTAGSFDSTDRNIRSIQDFHMVDRGWSDVGYHFLVGGDGQIYEGRSIAYQGAHVGGHNTGSVGISCLGCFDTVECHPPQYHEVQSPTDLMIHSVGRLIGMLAHRYNASINHDTVKGHREFSGTATSCPGDLILARMNEIRAIAQLTRENLEALPKRKDEL